MSIISQLKKKCFSGFSAFPWVSQLTTKGAGFAHRTTDATGNMQKTSPWCAVLSPASHLLSPPTRLGWPTQEGLRPPLIAPFLVDPPLTPGLEPGLPKVLLVGFALSTHVELLGGRFHQHPEIYFPCGLRNLLQCM